MPGRAVPEWSPASDDEQRWNAIFDAARAFIRDQHAADGCVVGIGEVLEHLDERFGEAAGITSDVTTVLNLCTTLWEDPHIDQVADGFIDFCWNEAGDWQREYPQGLLARLLSRSDAEEVR